MSLTAAVTAAAGPSCETHKGALLPSEALQDLDETEISVLAFDHQAAASRVLGGADFIAVDDARLADADWARELGDGGARENYLVNVCVYGGAVPDDEEMFDRWANSRAIRASYAGTERILQTSHFALGKRPDLTTTLVYVVHLPLPLDRVVFEAGMAE